MDKKMTLFYKILAEMGGTFALIFIGGIMGCLTILPIMASAATLTHQSGVEGSLFATLMSVYNLGQIFFSYLGGRLFSFLGLQALIVGTGLLGLLALVFIDQLDFKKDTG